MAAAEVHEQPSGGVRMEVSRDHRYVADWHRRSRREIVDDAVEAFATNLRRVTAKNKRKSKTSK